MARNPKQQYPTKKHLARMERERLQTRYILLGSLIVIVLVVAVIIYGVLDQTYLQGIRPVATVNGDKISTRDFQAQVRYGRYLLIRNAENTLQLAQIFGSDPQTASSFVQQLQQVQIQMEPETVGNQVLDQMIDNILIRQEAARRGITVTDEEVQKSFQEAFGFFPNGTPTPSPTFEPIPTSTLSPLQMTLVPPTSTPTATPVITTTATAVITSTETLSATQAVTSTASITQTPAVTEVLTPTATSAPTATPTPYTLEGYQDLYKKTIDSFQKDYNISEADLRYVIETGLYREKVMEAVLKDENITREQEEVWARHILVADEATASQVLDLLKSGQSFCKLAADFSTDTSNKDNCGDLNWFPKGQMDSDFEKAAFELKVGEVSQPVKTQFGYHIIQVLGHEMRPLSDSEYEQLRQQKFQDWLTKQRDASKVDINDVWKLRVPTVPTLPPQVDQFIQSFQSAQPSVPIPQPTP